MKQMNNPVYLSVVLSTYNDEKYIGKTIESILNQTYPYFEFIIVNDGSTDGTLEIIKSFKDERIVLIDKPNSGLPDSLNQGFAKAKYNWVARMDGDDIALPNRFELQVPHLNDKIAVLGGQVAYMDVDEHITGYSSLPLTDKGIKFQMNLFSSSIVHPTAIVNKHFFNLVGGYDNFLFGSEDYDLWYRISQYGSLKNIEQQVLQYRLNPNGVSLSKIESQILKGMVACVKKYKGIDGSLTKDKYNTVVNALQANKYYTYFVKGFEIHDQREGLIRKLSYLYILLMKHLTLVSLKV